MPPEKSVSAHKDTFFGCQKMTIAFFFVKKQKNAGIGDKKAGIGKICCDIYSDIFLAFIVHFQRATFTLQYTHTTAERL